MKTYYPAFINLKNKRCLVIGGGKVAERKVMSLIKTGANVTVISPELTSRLQKQKDKNIIRHIKRKYRKGDATGFFLIIAATDDEAVNKQVSEDAACLINVVDRPDMANFIVPSLVQRGPLTIAVSTSGASPAMAKALRKELELMYGKDFGFYLSFMTGFRKKVIHDIKDKKSREKIFKKAASDDIIAILRAKGFKAARETMLNIFVSAVKKGY
jgi:precorrin-2 dehydrogenase/sirohydrochlorin ferrochelatase